MSKTKSGHPKGLYVLFTTEMWERFNFYGMRAILSLFIGQALAFGDSDAAIIYGGFLGLCYLTPMLGGYISDRFLGNRNCILLGGITMAIGQLLLFFSSTLYASNLDLARTVMWAALLVLIFGNGFFKPNISSMVGSLYPKGDTRLDSAFTIFYMGINLGALIGNFICAQLGDVKHVDPVTHQEIRDLAAFKWGFLAAAGAMVTGTVVFLFLKNKYIVTPDGKPIGMKPSFSPAVAPPSGTVSGLAMDSAAEPELKTAESEKAHFTGASMLICLLMIVAFTFGFHYISYDAGAAKHNPIKEWLYPFIYSAGISLAILIISDKTITHIERQRIMVLYIVSFFVIFFWACFEQAGSSLTFIADQQTNLNLFGWNMPPAQVQNFNAFFIILLAFPFSWFWIQLAKKNADPISPVKQAIGLLLMAGGYYILATQVKGLANTAKIGVIWLGVMYLFHTMGELCLSPIGLSLVAKLAPKRFSSLLMGVWFLANAAGYALCGTLGSMLPNTGPKFLEAEKAGIDLQRILDKTITPTAEQLAQLKSMNIRSDYPVFAGFTIHNLYEFVMMFVLLPVVAGVLLLLISPVLKKMMHGVR